MFALDFLKLLFKSFLSGGRVQQVVTSFPQLIWLVGTQGRTDRSASPVFTFKFSVFLSPSCLIWGIWLPLTPDKRYCRK